MFVYEKWLYSSLVYKKLMVIVLLIKGNKCHETSYFGICKELAVRCDMNKTEFTLGPPYCCLLLTEAYFCNYSGKFPLKNNFHDII